MKKIKKNIILFMPFIGGGGVEKNLFIIANYLGKKLENLKICTLSKNQKRKFNSNIKFLSPRKNFYEKLNIRIKYLICLFILFKFLLKNRNTIVFSFQANIYCILICKILGIKVIVRSNSSPSGWYHNFFKKIIYKFIISLADKVIVNSMDFKNQMMRNFNIKVDCIYNPLNASDIIKKSKKDKKNHFLKSNKEYLKIINVGRLVEQKDQITILKAAKILKKKIKFQILILGKGLEEIMLRKYIKKNNLNQQIQIKPFLENPYGAMKQSDVFVLSSKFEGLPNVLLEAVVLKKFIISTNCPTGPREILVNGKGGLFFKTENHFDLAKKILLYYKNKNKLNYKNNISNKNLKKFNFEKNLKKYFLAIQSVI